MKPHIIGDSAFGNWDIFSAINDWKGTATLSVSFEKLKTVWSMLDHNLGPQNWRNAMKDNIIASSHAITDSKNKLVKQHILTTGFKGKCISMPESNENGSNSIGL